MKDKDVKGDLLQASVPRKALPTEEQIKSTWRKGASCRVSIVCHTYNHEPFIEQALAGFLIQRTEFPFEIIVHDDASTDNTARIIERYRTAYPDIVRPVLQTKNQYRLGIRPPCFTFPLARGIISRYARATTTGLMSTSSQNRQQSWTRVLQRLCAITTPFASAKKAVWWGAVNPQERAITPPSWR